MSNDSNDRFDDLMRDAAQTYRNPPKADFDAMWRDIETRLAVPSGAQRPTPNAQRAPRWLSIAATLVIGIGIGRATLVFNHASPQPATVAMAAGENGGARTDSIINNTYEVETSKYLGQTAALLIALPSEIKGGRTNAQFVGRAGELLTTTRLLIDSPAADDPQMRDLLEDLELVLAQVVRLQNNNSRTELDLINRALEQRDVLPRLRTAVGGYSAN